MYNENHTFLDKVISRDVFSEDVMEDFDWFFTIK